ARKVRPSIGRASSVSKKVAETAVEASRTDSSTPRRTSVHVDDPNAPAWLKLRLCVAQSRNVLYASSTTAMLLAASPPQTTTRRPGSRAASGFNSVECTMPKIVDPVLVLLRLR